MARSDVYAAIDGERDYQDRKWGSIEQRPKQLGSWITLMRVILTDAEVAWAHSKGDADALEECRKLAATAVACLEQHGVKKRKHPEPQGVIEEWSVDTLS